MTDLEKISKPVTYFPLPDFTSVSYKGMSEDEYGLVIRYIFCVGYNTKNLTKIKCYSWLNSHNGVIAEFKVKKLHDTR